MSSPGDPPPRYPRGRRRAEFATELAERFCDNPVPVEDLAAEVGRSPSFVRRLLEEAGVRMGGMTCVGMPEHELVPAWRRANGRACRLTECTGKPASTGG